MSDQIEIEIKFFLTNPEEMHTRLLALGASPNARVFETNYCYDNKQGAIYANGQLLRLRQDEKSRLTLKIKPPAEDSQVKIFRELEVEVSDFQTMDKILTTLGYSPVIKYEKWRQVFNLGATTVCMDSLPYGNFLEIESDRQSIRQIAEHLGLDWKKRILTNYLAIFDQLKSKYHLTFTHLTFADFASGSPSIMPLLKNFEIGS